MNPRKIAVLVIASTVMSTSTTFALDASMQMTGASFLNACSRADESWISFCNGYVQAAVDSLREGDGVCMPSGTTRTAIVTVVHRSIATSAELQAANGLDAVRTVMQMNYACR